jgi:transcriptional regulator with XRE-family HTH domain
MPFNTPYLVRRARLLMDMTQEDFAEEFEVDPATVSSWEHGKLHPAPSVWKRIREIGLHTSGPLADDVIRASLLFKRVASMEDLRTSVVVSRGIFEEYHISPNEIAEIDDLVTVSPSHPLYNVSTSRLCDMIQADSQWLTGGVIYVEAHTFSIALEKWIDVTVTPLPDKDAALMEFALSRKGCDRGFRVHFAYFDPELRKC